MWVGDNAGGLYYTDTGALTDWTAVVVPDATSIEDIVFATNEAGYVAFVDSANHGKLYATTNGGQLWTTTTPRIDRLPTVDRINRVAVPQTIINPSVDANYVLCACLHDDASDGLILYGVAPTIF
jgi:photosystem II stability/assembly factor-like uncharacterized protein